MTMKKHWIHRKNTYVLLVERTNNKLPELHPVGVIIKRQVYDGEEPRWYTWMYDESAPDGKKLLGRFESQKLAMQSLECTIA
jgi:hypothetical protein